MRISTRLAVAVVPLALLAAACGGDDDGDGSARSDGATTTEQASQDHNQADVEFAQMMIPHHRQAVEMAVLAPAQAESPEIRDLATRIEGAQDPEIEQMTAWLEEWGEEAPAEAPAGDDAAGGDATGSSAGGDAAGGSAGGAGGSTTTAGMDHTGGDMAGDSAGDSGHGMMSAEDMSALAAASGAEFDRIFAEMMIEHHEGAVAMANDEIEQGQHAGALDLASAIVEAQEAEIAELQAFLGPAR